MTTDELAERFGIPADSELLQEALTHPSFANERRRVAHYQRLEFLGDAVLELCVSELLFERYPTATEGALTRMRAQLVSGDALATWARGHEVAGALRLGKGAEGDGLRDNSAVLADAVEALVAAAYLTEGLDGARHACLAVVGEALDSLVDPELLDPKSQLQEQLQRQRLPAPSYEVTDSGGVAHEPWFEVRVLVAGRELGRGRGRSKRVAERSAAACALDTLHPDRGFEADGLQSNGAAS